MPDPIIYNVDMKANVTGDLAGYKNVAGQQKYLGTFTDSTGTALLKPDGGSVSLGGGGIRASGVAAMRMSSGGGNVTASNPSVQQAVCANQKFYGVRICMVNYSTTLPLSVTNMKVAASPTLTNNGSALAWSQVTWNNGSITASIGTATAGVANNNIPTIMFSDVIPVTAVARTDVPGDPYLLYVRTYDAALLNTTGPMLKEGDPNAAWLSAKGYTCRAGSAAGDQVTSTASGITMSSSFPPSAISSVDFFDGGNNTSFVAFGDSLLAAASGNATNYTSGWTNRVQSLMRTKGVIGGVSNWGFGGMKQEVYIGIMKSMCALTHYDMVYFAPFSPNTGVSQASYESQFVIALAAVNWLLDRGMRPIISTTPALSNSVSGAEQARLDFNTRIKALSSICTVWDFASVIDSKATPGTIDAAYIYQTGPHWNDAGDQALADYIALQLSLN